MGADDLVAELALVFAAMFLAGVAGGFLFLPPHRTRPRPRFTAIRTFWHGGVRFGSSRAIHSLTESSRQRLARLIGISPFRLYQNKTWVYFRERKEVQCQQML
jgi:hypothetical protein